MARRFTGPRSCAAYLLRAGGVPALYVGGAVNALRESVFLGTYFAAYEASRRALQGGVALAPSAAIPLAGAGAGATAWAASMPLDTVKTGVQSALVGEPPRRGAAVAAELWRGRGLSGLYAGVLPSVLRAGLVSSSRFAAYEATLAALRGTAGVGAPSGPAAM